MGSIIEAKIDVVIENVMDIMIVRELSMTEIDW